MLLLKTIRSSVILAFHGIIAIGPAAIAAKAHFWDEIPESPSTTPPVRVLDDYWSGQFQRVNREVAAAESTELVFFGDSITWSWSLGPATGKELWEREFSPFSPINMGNSGDITPVMLYRVTHGNLDFAKDRQPKVAVILCGINNLIVKQSAGGKETWALGPDCPPEDIAHGQRAVAQVFRRKLPQTRVILMALLPVADPAKWQICQRVNAINARLAHQDDETVFLNLQDRFLLPDGTLNRALFTDGTHLSKEGYQQWADGIRPLIDGYVKGPPLAPTKIMLIGSSATEGVDSGTSYRRYLDGMLRRSGLLVDFVGSRRKHQDDAQEPDTYQFDPDHEGHWGGDSAGIAEKMSGILESNVPDVAVVHLGAEDIAASDKAAEPLAEEILQNIGRVIGQLRAKNGKVKIVIANALPVAGKQEVVDLLNRKLRAFADATSSPSQPVVIAAIERDFNVAEDAAPGTGLPNAGGAMKIAKTLADAIVPLGSRNPAK